MHYAHMHGLSIHAYMLYSPVYLSHKRVNLEKNLKVILVSLESKFFIEQHIQNPLKSSLGEHFMPSSVLVHLTFQIPKNVNAISWKTLLIRNALCLLYKLKLLMRLL